MKHLQRLAEIRCAIESLKAEAESIEADAILEAFDIVESETSVNGKSLVFSDTNAKIVLVLRNRYDDKNTSVVRLDEDINREYDKLCRSNATAIENNKAYIQELTEMIEAAEAKQETLLVSPYLETLRKQRAIALKKTEHKVPSLAVYVK
ncbi:MAG: hypothetical protein EAZ73_09200 [Oscillatoriales cyanobacterium]|uniref:hypothetical protein n=1 Tax=unclassified Microcoleus TaxID=2642155 RepID=UPI001D72341F|nr:MULTISPECIES: hypothetical protein [unclassified Microcoleus]TAF00849.1 MAG: hypothetical protein EAZ79_01395 [Oscillatoriales cyanobacterium]MCC3459813.1 hypothetical protein [Microcoleus sp. PH2017_11_PCY_U_A]MCC3478247.1 hypothetical protein [Microcoleus sp. PH2017_12_PCY_D_A]TAF21392.1 MAG: hypothetical protein EAZ73_09200 [Oscillatoriales cyanobacterium]TAF39681.1 MAG: hypothetical protein EAZ69_00145 [Oscillatoriales cyanobacterium]